MAHLQLRLKQQLASDLLKYLLHVRSPPPIFAGLELSAARPQAVQKSAPSASSQDQHPFADTLSLNQPNKPSLGVFALVSTKIPGDYYSRRPLLATGGRNQRHLSHEGL